MPERLVYLLSVVAIGWAVTFGLRALPFLVFAGRDRELPPWVERLGAVISPVIIAGLVVYSYSGLEWRTAWPYLAGLLTVGLHLWKRNALASIVTGTVVYMLLLGCGCTTRQVNFDAENPAVTVTSAGVLFEDEKVAPKEVPEILDDMGVPRSCVIHILLEPGVRAGTPAFGDAKAVMGCLVQAGYRRSIFVTRRQATSKAEPRRPSAKKRPRRAVQ